MKKNFPVFARRESTYLGVRLSRETHAELISGAPGNTFPGSPRRAAEAPRKTTDLRTAKKKTISRIDD